MKIFFVHRESAGEFKQTHRILSLSCKTYQKINGRFYLYDYSGYVRKVISSDDFLGASQAESTTSVYGLLHRNDMERMWKEYNRLSRA